MEFFKPIQARGIFRKYGKSTLHDHFKIPENVQDPDGNTSAKKYNK